MDQAVIAHLVLRDANQAIEFYKRAFGFAEVMRIPRPDGKPLHAVMSFRGQQIFMAEEFVGMGPGAGQPPQALGGSCVTLHLSVENADAAFAQAISAGATSVMPVSEMFWGDRYGKVIDPFGHHWSMSHTEKVLSPAEMNQRAKEVFAKNRRGEAQPK